MNKTQSNKLSVIFVLFAFVFSTSTFAEPSKSDLERRAKMKAQIEAMKAKMSAKVAQDPVVKAANDYCHLFVGDPGKCGPHNRCQEVHASFQKHSHKKRGFKINTDCTKVSQPLKGRCVIEYDPNFKRHIEYGSFTDHEVNYNQCRGDNGGKYFTLPDQKLFQTNLEHDGIYACYRSAKNTCLEFHPSQKTSALVYQDCTKDKGVALKTCSRDNVIMECEVGLKTTPLKHFFYTGASDKQINALKPHCRKN